MTGVAMPVNFQSDIANALAKGSYRATAALAARADEPNTVTFASRAPSQPAVCSPAVSRGTLRQVGLISSPASAFWVRDFRGCDLWPTSFSRLFRCPVVQDIIRQRVIGAQKSMSPM